MTCVYILTSTNKDTYYEQTLISILSLRKVMKDVKIVILTDEKTNSTLIDKRRKHEEYNVEVKIIEVPEKFNNRDRSRFLKTTMYNYIDDDFIFIDSDTIICEKLNSIFNKKFDIGMVLNRHLKISESPSINFLCDEAKKNRWHTGINDKHFNSGVIAVKRGNKSALLFNEWHKLWNESRNKYSGVVFDQTSLNEANYRLNGVISEIDGVWNCQVNRNCKCLPYIHDAKILHLFTSPSVYCHDLANNEIIKSILNSEHSELDIILKNPKAAFSSVYDLNSDINSVKFSKTPLYNLLKKEFETNSLTFKCLNISAKLILKCKK